MSVSISPIWSGTQFFDENGDPLAGGKIYTYENGSFSVQQTTYDDEAGTVPNSNPIVLDSSGRINNGLFLTNGLVYNLVLTNSDDTIITSVDGVIGVSNLGAGQSGVWVKITDTTEYVSASSFRVLGTYTIEFSIGNRVLVEFSTNTEVYGTVTNVTFDGTYTQVTVLLDSGSITNNISFVYYGAMTVTEKPADAGAITYSLPSSYTDPNTIGYQIKENQTNITNVNSRVTSVRTVWSTSGSINYTATITPTFNSYTNDKVFTILFGSGNGGSVPTTLNINSIGSYRIYSYDSTGAQVDPIITNNMISDVVFDGTSFILLDTIPGATPSPTFPSRGMSVYNSSGSFVVPANVTYLEVTTVGGGGGGGVGSAQVNESGVIDYRGGTGGNGAIATKGVTVVAGNTYSVTIGAAGLPGAGGGTTTFGSDLCKSGGGSAGANATPFGNGSNGADGSLLVYDYGTTPPQIITAGLRGAGGLGGLGLLVVGSSGTAGCCIIKW
jgi:hypothetical protein